MSIRARVLRWLGLSHHADLIDGLRRDLEQHGRAHSGVVLEVVQQLNTTSTFARDTRLIADETAYRLRVYETHVPALAKVKSAQDAKVTRARKKAEAAAALAAEPVVETPDMAVTDGESESAADVG